MGFEPLPPIRLEPLEIAPDTFLLRSAQAAFGAPLSVSLNSLLILGTEPTIVDTNTRANRGAWISDLTSLVDPIDVRWVFLSHDDEDHTGNLGQVLDLCPNATLITSWAATERMGCSFAAPADRMRWVDDGDEIRLGDRRLRALRPPVYDSPATRALFDCATGVLWASDAFATPMPAQPVDKAADLDPQFWIEGMTLFHHHVLCPWLAMVDRSRYRAAVEQVRVLDPVVVVGAHTPVITEPMIGEALDHLAALPDLAPPPHPNQQALAAAIADHGDPTR